MVTRNNDDIKPCEILSAAAMDKRFNHNLLEHSWYGLWNDELLVLRNIKHTFIYPQKNIVMKIEADEAHSEYMPTPRSTASTAGSTPASRRAATTPSTPLPQFTDAATSLAPPKTPVRQRGFVKLYSDSPVTFKTPTATDNPPVKVRNAENKRLARLRSEVEDMESVSPYSPNKKYVTRQKIPDFGICSYTGCERKYNDAGRPRGISIGRRVIPVLVEVKLYKKNNGDNSEDEEVSEDDEDDEDYEDDEYIRQVENLGITSAAQDLTEQVKYLFSLNSTEEQQSGVIAIAAAGPFWSWCQFKNVGGIAVANMDIDSTSRVGAFATYSSVYRAGRPDSAAMLDKICDWIEKLLEDPTAENLDLIDEPDAEEREAIKAAASQVMHLSP